MDHQLLSEIDIVYDVSWKIFKQALSGEDLGSGLSPSLSKHAQWGCLTFWACSVGLLWVYVLSMLSAATLSFFYIPYLHVSCDQLCHVLVECIESLGSVECYHTQPLPREQYFILKNNKINRLLNYILDTCLIKAVFLVHQSLVYQDYRSILQLD